MKRVLIVEDEFTTRELMQAMLRKAHYEVVGVAADAETALVACQEKNPDVVLLDIELQSGNGLEVLETLHASQPEIVVIMVSGEVYAERVMQAQQLGADGFVAKPFNIERLIRAMDRARVNRAMGSTRSGQSNLLGS